MGDAFFFDEGPYVGGFEFTETDVGCADCGYAPGKTPAIAMKHRECPEVYGLGGHVGFDGFVDGVEVGAAVGIDHAFGTAGGA